VDGQPIVQIADRQTTGGQPKIDFVASLGRPLLAQIAPGDGVRFEVVALGQEACDWVVVQVGALAGVAASQGGRLSHANAHDALYNRAAKDARLARGIARAVRDIGPGLLFHDLAGSVLESEPESLGLRLASEVFCPGPIR
jgi:UPF0271 protein